MAARDEYGAVGIKGTPLGLIAPGDEWANLSSSISDSTDLSVAPRALYAHVAGNVCCVSRTGSSAIFTFAAGEIKSLRPYRIMATNTSTGFVTSGALIGIL